MKYLNKEGEISFGNVYLSAEENFFHKLGSLLSHQTTRSIEECWFKCVQNKECLSVNTIALDKSRYRCQLLNWAGTGFEKYLVPKANSKFMQMQFCISCKERQSSMEATVLYILVSSAYKANLTPSAAFSGRSLMNRVHRNIAYIKCRYSSSEHCRQFTVNKHITNHAKPGILRPEVKKWNLSSYEFDAYEQKNKRFE
ncbi:hypothetical protein AC249_AIPGENE29005 [Exaiptasia diaphana]|nr:hypothetical protein AC249_AIPGENE29005 [Exaiptasia diaphana]